MKKYFSIMLAISFLWTPQTRCDALADLFRQLALIRGLINTALEAATDPIIQPGTEDKTFGTDGIFNFQIDGTQTDINKMTHLIDGRLVMLDAVDGNSVNLLISPRKLSAATDISSLAIAGLNTPVALATNGTDKIYTLGNTGTPSPQLRAYTSSPDTSSAYVLDGTFGTNGIFNPGSGTPYDLILYKGALFTLNLDNVTLELHKTTLSGAADSDFNSGAGLDLSSSFAGETARLAGYGDHVYVAGDGSENKVIMKFNATTGVQVESGFGTSGVANTGLANGTHTLVDIAIDQSSGAIYTAYYAGVNTIIAKFTTAGVLDATWGTSGLATIAGFGSPAKLLIKSGQVYVIGNDGNARVTRLTSAGTLDTDFGSGGSITTNEFVAAKDAFFSGKKMIVAGANNPNGILWQILSSSGSGTASDIIADTANEFETDAASGETSGGALGGI
jgi:hypothetical protein